MSSDLLDESVAFLSGKSRSIKSWEAESADPLKMSRALKAVAIEDRSVQEALRE
jgi:hypothetical protein